MVCKMFDGKKTVRVSKGLDCLKRHLAIKQICDTISKYATRTSEEAYDGPQAPLSAGEGINPPKTILSSTSSPSR